VNLLELFLSGAALDPAKTAVVDDGFDLSFRNLVRAARGLGSLVDGATRREVVGIFLPTCKEFVISYLACLAAARTTLPFNILLSAEDLEFVASDAGVDTVVTSRRFLGVMEGKTPGCEAALRRAVGQVICLEDVAGTRWKKMKLLARGAFFRPRIVPEDELVTLLYTSGTTGRPKGVCLTHRNIVANIRAAVEAVGYTGEDVAVQVLPLFHTFALTVTMGAPLAYGGTSVALKRFVPDRVLDVIERHRVTYLVAIPSMFRVLNRCQRAKPRDVGSLTCAISGGEPLPAEVREGFRELFGLELLEGYGLTETSPVVSLNPPAANRPGSVGRPLRGVEVAIADDSGAVGGARPGSVGEICVRGPSVMRCYHDRPEETAAVLSADGWFRTGDFGRLDREGYLWITGRKKEMMIVGGENVFPAEIEDCLSRHPAVAEVGVVGVPDARRGEAPKAFVVLAEGASATAEDLSRFCRERLPLPKVPREIVFRGELPKSPTGKVMRRLLRDTTKATADVRR
jgi:long-chain acyl-CoA synthetase